MKIKITLGNPKYCDSCPCCVCVSSGIICTKDYWYDTHDKEESVYQDSVYQGTYVIRPEKCKEENGL